MGRGGRWAKGDDGPRGTMGRGGRRAEGDDGPSEMHGPE